MKTLIAMVTALPLAAGAVMLERTELIEALPEAKASRNGHEIYFDRSGLVEVWRTGAERVAFDREAEDRPEGFVTEGEWRVKTLQPPEDFDKKSAEEREAILERIEKGNAELRSVFCVTVSEREKCWDVDRTSDARVDPKDAESELAKTQDYHLYREGRAETQDMVITFK